MRVGIPIRAQAIFLLAAATVVWVRSANGQAFADQLTAVSAHVGNSGEPVRIQIFEWSSDEDRERLITALDPPPPETAPPAPEGRGGRGRADRGRGAFGGRGRGGRGARPVDPVLAALNEAPTVGYLWTDRVAGYAIRYAYRSGLPGGGERIILATHRRLGAYTTSWDPVITDYEFTLIEIRLDENGNGEGKASLTAEVVVDPDAGTVALDDFEGTTAVLEDIRR